MGKKTRIVLLSITVALAVFTFSLMWIVRPDSQNSVLDSARERQAEPLLHVSEPLETDAATLSAEEEMADRVSQILASDEEFLSAVAAAVAENISLDDYIPDMVEKVYSRISEDYDAIAADIASRLDENFEENVLSLYEKYKNELVSDIILSILSEYEGSDNKEKTFEEYIREKEESDDRKRSMLTISKLRTMPPQATLDLHGDTAKEAEEEVRRFLSECSANGLRKISIITGKGLHSEDGVGVLRETVLKVLDDSALVSERANAPLSAGGSGALWIILKA